MSLVPFKLVLLLWNSEEMSLSTYMCGPFRGMPGTLADFCLTGCFLQLEIMVLESLVREAGLGMGLSLLKGDLNS